jgi:LysR family nitrogen assimilation transcriptional regulator
MGEGAYSDTAIGLRDMRLFVAVYEERSFTAAAVREHATQSGVSQRIGKIEARCGVRLFLRETGSVVPTPAGENYYSHCLAVLRSNDAALRALMQFERGLEGRITVGLMPTMTRCVLAPALAAFVEANPNVIVRVVEAYSGALTAQVRKGELDFAIVPAMAELAGVRAASFMRTPEVLISNGSLGTRHMEPVQLAALAPLSIVVPGPLNARRHSLDNYFLSQGVAIRRRLELDAMLGTLDLVGRADWVAVLPGLMMAGDAREGPYVVNPLASPALSTDLVLIEPVSRTLSPAAAAFLALLEREAARLDEVWQGSTA